MLIFSHNSFIKKTGCRRIEEFAPPIGIAKKFCNIALMSTKAGIKQPILYTLYDWNFRLLES